MDNLSTAKVKAQVRKQEHIRRLAEQEAARLQEAEIARLRERIKALEARVIELGGRAVE